MTTENHTPTENTDIRHEAAGNLAFLLSVVRCGEQLSPEEEENVRRVIKDLERASMAVDSRLSEIRRILEGNPTCGVHDGHGPAGEQG